MKKVFITGHTSGIGQATYDLLSKDYTVEGGSRSTGFDIGDADCYKQLLDYDILINNAYHATGQVQLLKNMYEHWKGQPKVIVNVGSYGKDTHHTRPLPLVEYHVAKKALEAYSYWITENDRVCKSMMYNPGFVKTPLGLEGLKNWSEEIQQKFLERVMDAEACAETIKFMIENPYKFKEVTHLS
jgi:NAD(P)-dependent dehydrogenase (short-subunit alcohol dehydrogenase family)